MKRTQVLFSVAAMTIGLAAAKSLAVSYASDVQVSGTSGSFILNAPATSVTITYGDNSTQTFLTPAAGKINFTLPTAGSTFKIAVTNNEGAGYTTVGAAAGSSTFGAATKLQISSDAAAGFSGYSVARGVAVNTNPNAGAAFGEVYASGASGNTAGQGVFGVTAAGTTFSGGANAPSNGDITWASSTSSPWRIRVGDDNNLYISDFADAHADTFRLTSSLQTPAGSGSNVLATIGYSPDTNHGNAIALATTGSEAAGNLVLYTLDEDYQDTSHSNATYNILKYSIGGAIPSGGYTGTPTILVSSASGGPLGSTFVNATSSDMFVNKTNGNIYFTQNRTSGTVSHEFSLDIFKPDGTLIYNSQDASGTAEGASPGQDYLRQAWSVAVSDDGKYMALGLTNGMIDIVPLNADGTPNLAAGGLISGAFTQVPLGSTASADYIRSVAFDAADNLYAIQAADAKIRVFSPGGGSVATTNFDGTNYSFGVVAAPEPTTIACLGLAGLGGLVRRRRA